MCNNRTQLTARIGPGTTYFVFAFWYNLIDFTKILKTLCSHEVILAKMLTYHYVIIYAYAFLCFNLKIFMGRNNCESFSIFSCAYLEKIKIKVSVSFFIWSYYKIETKKFKCLEQKIKI